MFVVRDSLICFALTLALLALLRPILINYFLDSPDERSSHQQPIPTGAGISFVITSFIASIISGWYIPLFCLPLSLIGFLDDKFNLSRIIRYGGQIFTAFLIVNYSLTTNINLKALFESNPFGNVISISLIFGITAIINFTNFMDGLDGFLGSSFFVAFLFLSVTYETNLVFLTAGIFAFLIFNWHPAKMFMGDVGSTFLGAVFAGLIIQKGNVLDILMRLLILSPIFMDSLFTLIRRIKNRQKIFTPHKLHVYQRLNQAGMKQSQISIIYALGVFILCLVSLLNNVYFLILAVIVELLFGIYLSSISKPFKKL